MGKKRWVDLKGKKKNCPECGNKMEFIEFILFGDICPEWNCGSCGHVIYLPETKCRRGKK